MNNQRTNVERSLAYVASELRRKSSSVRPSVRPSQISPTSERTNDDVGGFTRAIKRHLYRDISILCTVNFGFTVSGFTVFPGIP